MAYSLYKITNTINGKFYIGLTSRALKMRFNEHLSTAMCSDVQSHFYRSIRKNGRKAFSIELIFEVDTREEAIDAEIRLIRELKPQYNSTIGGEGAAGRIITDAFRKRMSEVHKGNKYCLGKKHSDETRAILREIGLSNREEWLKRSGAGPAASSKQVVCLNDGSQYPSASAAARYYGLAKSLVIEVCQRQPRRLTAGGKVFRYLGDHSGGPDEVEEISARYVERKRAGSMQSRKPVRCLNDGILYQSAADAGQIYGISRGHIQDICRGTKNSRAGLRFVYEENIVVQ